MFLFDEFMRVFKSKLFSKYILSYSANTLANARKQLVHKGFVLFGQHSETFTLSGDSDCLISLHVQYMLSDVALWMFYTDA